MLHPPSLLKSSLLPYWWLGCLLSLLSVTPAWGFLPGLPPVINVPPDTAPEFVAAGQTLNLYAGELVDVDERMTFQEGSAFNMYGGEIGGGALIALPGSKVNLYDGFGSSGGSFQGEITIHGGRFYEYVAINTLLTIKGGENFAYVEDSQVEMSGGDAYFTSFLSSNIQVTDGLLKGFEAMDDTVIDVYGGQFGTDEFPVAGALYERSQLNLYGGRLKTGGPDTQGLLTGSGTVTFFGSRFVLDGELLTGLTEGDELTIPQRDVWLSGLLADGSPFRFPLTDDGEGAVPLTYRVVVQSVPEPGALALTLLGLTFVGLRRRVGESSLA